MLLIQFPDWIGNWAQTTPDKTAIVFNGRHRSYSELENDIARLASVLQHDFGIGKGDRVAWLGNNSPRVIDTLFACARIGAILVPLNWRLAVAELKHLIDDAGARLLIVGKDQLEDYAKRKGMTVEEMEKWLRPNLGY